VIGTTVQIQFSGRLGSCASNCPGFTVRDASTGAGFFFNQDFINSDASGGPSLIQGILTQTVQPGEQLTVSYSPGTLVDQTGAPVAAFSTFPGVPAAMLTGKGAEWYQHYKQLYHQEPASYAAYGYDAMSVALAAIERVGKKDRAAIRDAIFATQDYDGVLGTWSFTASGDTTLTTMSVRQVRNGTWDPTTVQVVEGPR
jgi:Periplasmic binding protein